MQGRGRVTQLMLPVPCQSPRPLIVPCPGFRAALKTRNSTTLATNVGSRSGLVRQMVKDCAWGIRAATRKLIKLSDALEAALPVLARRPACVVLFLRTADHRSGARVEAPPGRQSEGADFSRLPTKVAERFVTPDSPVFFTPRIHNQASFRRPLSSSILAGEA